MNRNYESYLEIMEHADQEGGTNFYTHYINSPNGVTVDNKPLDKPFADAWRLLASAEEALGRNLNRLVLAEGNEPL